MHESATEIVFILLLVYLVNLTPLISTTAVLKVPDRRHTEAADTGEEDCLGFVREAVAATAVVIAVSNKSVFCAQGKVLKMVTNMAATLKMTIGWATARKKDQQINLERN